MSFIKSFCGLSSQNDLANVKQKMQLGMYLYSFVNVILIQLVNAGRKFSHRAISFSLVFLCLIKRMRLGFPPFLHFRQEFKKIN